MSYYDFCISYVEIQKKTSKTNLVSQMMIEAKIQQQVTATTAGDDGEAVAKSQETEKKKACKKPNEGIRKPGDASWYVAVVRVNCEVKIAESIQSNLNFNDIWFEYWVPMVKVAYIDRRTNKRKFKEKLFLSTFIFCNVSPTQLDKIRFRSDVYKMLTMPGQRGIYKVPDKEIIDYRNLVENDEEPVSATPAPLRKGIKVRVMAGKMKGLEAYVQRYNGKKAVIGNEIKYVSGATIEISRDLLEVVE